MPATIAKTIKLHPVQAAFRKSNALYRGFVGGRGSGKSWAGAYDMIRRAQRDHTYMIASPTSVLMQDTTFPTFKQLCRELNVLGNVKLTPYPNVELTTGATIRFRTAEDPEKMRGPNLSGIWLDEASLMVKEAFTISIACLREGGKQGWLSATFTPKGINHWTYEVFGRGMPDTEIFRSHTSRNPFLPPEFAETIRKQYTEDEARQELGGEFIDAEEHLQVIPTAWVRAAQERWRPEGKGNQKLSAIGVDVARGGSAKTVLAPRHGTWFAPLRKHPGASTPDGPAVAALVAHTLVNSDNPTALVVVDSIGVGSSVFDECKRRRFNVIGCNFASGTNATDRTGIMTFVNVRAFAWWSMRELLDPANKHDVQLPPDPELLADLTAPRWKAVTGGVQIEKKEEVEKRIGRSPDAGDAVVYSIVMPPR